MGPMACHFAVSFLVGHGTLAGLLSTKHRKRSILNRWLFPDSLSIACAGNQPISSAVLVQMN
jgi:hypothetical protein